MYAAAPFTVRVPFPDVVDKVSFGWVMGPAQNTMPANRYRDFTATSAVTLVWAWRASGDKQIMASKTSRQRRIMKYSTQGMSDVSRYNPEVVDRE
jgi:hypothetical protein